LRCSTHKIDVLFTDLLSPYKEKFEEHGIKIVLNIEESISDISVDAILISQAFQNVIDNSIEALQNGGYFLISVVKFDEEKGTIVITFSDSGEGIEDRNVKNIFRPFYTTKTSGTGLGLSFARRVIEAHNGKIWVCSKNSCKGYYNNECKKARKINGKYLSGTSIHIMLPTNLD
jgi:signal transduction histidine kinase